MNYKKIYDNLVLKYKNLKVEGYKERHHILPRCMDGTDNPDNLVDVPARVHFVMHLLLMRIYPKNYGLVYAALRMSCSHLYTSRQYDWLRKVASRSRTENFSGCNSFWYGREITESHHKSLSECKTGSRNPVFGTQWMYNTEISKHIHVKNSQVKQYLLNGWRLGRCLSKKHSEHCRQVSKGRLNMYHPTLKKYVRPYPNEINDYLSRGFVLHKRGPVTEETRRKLRESHLGQVTWNKGRHWSDEMKKKLAVNTGRVWMHHDQTGIRFMVNQQDITRFINDGYVYGKVIRRKA